MEEPPKNDRKPKVAVLGLLSDLGRPGASFSAADKPTGMGDSPVSRTACRTHRRALKAVDKPTGIAQSREIPYRWVRQAFRAIQVDADTGGFVNGRAFARRRQRIRSVQINHVPPFSHLGPAVFVHMPDN